MPRVHTVEHAQKDYPEAGIKKGDKYYWWAQKIMSGGGWHSRKTKSLTYPKPSQLTQSEFLGTLLSIQENAEDAVSKAETMEDLDAARQDAVQELADLRDETQDKLSNMPEGLQQGNSGQILQERVDGLEDVISELEGIDIPDDSQVESDADDDVPEVGPDMTQETRDDEVTERMEERRNNVAEEILSALGNLPS